MDKKNMKIEDALLEASDNLKLKDEMVNMSSRRILNGLEAKRNRKRIKFISVFATALLLVFSILATTVLAFPGVAAKVAPNIPLVKEIAKRDTQLVSLNNTVNTYKEADVQKQEEINALKTEVEELKIKVKEISDELIKEIETSDNTDEAQNLQVQSLVIEFVKLMYKGKYEEAAKYCTEKFAETVINKPEDVIMRPQSTSVIFTQITNVAKVNDTQFMVFLRLNDSGADMEADYQLDFEIVLIDDVYLISFVGIDA
jgi:hypothetical protein